MNIYLDSENEQKLEYIYAVLSQDDKGEGIISHITRMGAMPLVFGHEKMIGTITEIMNEISNESGKKLILAKFKRVVE